MSGFIDSEKEGILVFFARFFDAIAGFIGLIIFARVLDIGGLGTYFVLSATVYMVSRPVAGFGVSVKKRMSEPDTPTMEYLTIGIFFTFLYTTIVSIISYVAYLIFIQKLQLYQISFTLFVVSIVFFIFQSFLHISIHSYEGLGNPGKSQFAGTIRGIIETLLQLTLIILGFSIEGLLLGSAISAVVVTSATLIYSELSIEIPSIKSFWYLLTYSRWSILSSIAQSIYSNIDEIIIGSLLSPSVAGYYGSAKRLSQPASFATVATSRILFLQTSNESKKGKNVDKRLVTATKYSTLISVPILFGSLVFPEKILALTFQPEYKAGGYILIAAALWKILDSYNSVYSSFLNGIDKPSLGTTHTAIRAVVSITGYPLAIYLFGTQGLGFALVATQIPSYIYLKWKINGITDNEWSFRNSIIPQVISGLLMALVLELLLTSVNIATLSQLFGVVLVGGFVYASVLISLDRQIRAVAKSYVSQITT